MKARVKSNGRIIEVEKAMIGYAECAVANIDGFPAQNFYAEDELEFLPDTPEEVTIEGYVARDQFDHNNLNLHCEKPYRDGNDIYNYEDEGFWDNDKEKYFPLPDEMFPEVTWQSQPKRVRITLTPIEE